jgi:hypothetical protein
MIIMDQKTDPDQPRNALPNDNFRVNFSEKIARRVNAARPIRSRTGSVASEGCRYVTAATNRETNAAVKSRNWFSLLPDNEVSSLLIE